MAAKAGQRKARGGAQTKRGAAAAAPGKGRATAASLPMLRTSERGAMKMCEFLWDLTYNQGRRPIYDMPALRFGSLCHKALASWYIPGVKRGEHPAEAFERFYQEDLRENETVFGMRVGDEEKWVNAHELGIAMLQNYVEEYGKDDRYEVLVTEYPFETTVLDENGEPWFTYVGVLDGVWLDRKDKTIWIPDHKTTSGLGGTQQYPKFPSHLLIDDQAGAYWSWGVQALRESKLIRPTQQINGMLYNFLRKAMPDERPSKIVKGRRVYVNKDGSLSKKQPSPYFARFPVFRDVYDRGEQMERSKIDHERLQMFREGTLAITKSPGMFTCPMCSMRDVCELHETGNDWQSFLRQSTETWDPYSEHEVYAGR